MPQTSTRCHRLTKISAAARTALYVFVLAAVPRVVLALLDATTHGINYIPQLETYADFQSYYVQWLHYIAAGQIPYRDFFDQYPPLFLYSLLPFYLLAGKVGAALAIALSDAASASVIFLIVQRKSTRTVALMAGIGYAVSPFALLYEGYVLFSVQPMLLFVLIAILLLDERKLVPSAAALAVALMMNQQALFILPVYAIYAVKFGRREFAKGVAFFAGIVVAVSVPFLLVAPLQYIRSMAYRPVPYPTLGSNSSSTTGTGSGTTPLSSTSCHYVVNETRVVETCVVNGVTTIFTNSVPLLYRLTLVTNFIFEFALIPLSVLALVAVLYVRRKPDLFPLAGAFAAATLVLLFALFVSYVPLDQEARYSYLPAYALLMTAGGSKKLPIASSAFAAVGLLLPPGIVQMALPYLAIIAVVAIRDSDMARAAGGKVSPSPSVPPTMPLVERTGETPARG